MSPVKLSSVNKVLRVFGFVLVVATSDEDPTLLWIERQSTFDRRACVAGRVMGRL